MSSERVTVSFECSPDQAAMIKTAAGRLGQTEATFALTTALRAAEAITAPEPAQDTPRARHERRVNSDCPMEQRPLATTSEAELLLLFCGPDDDPNTGLARDELFLRFVPRMRAALAERVANQAE